MGGDGAQDPFHHGKVFFTVVCLKTREQNKTLNRFNFILTMLCLCSATDSYLEESSPEVILNEYTADTPDVTGMVPTQI